MIKRILHWFPFQMGAIVTVVMLFSFILSFGYIEPSIEESKREFVADCKTQGGKFIDLNDTKFCIIDGQKFRW